MSLKKLYLLISLFIFSCAFSEEVSEDIDRTSIPVPDKPLKTYTEMDIRDVKENELTNVYNDIKAPEGAPNVLIILIDDFGFGQSSAFGGPINMPNAEQLAKDGLKYNQFHTVSISAATRTALLTGRNHHTNNMATITETATSMPGYDGVRPNNIAALPKILKYNGYSTAMFGKTHEVPAWQTSSAGPNDLWPTGVGFDKFYGFMAAESNQFEPILMDGMTHIPTPRKKGYNLNDDLAEKTTQWIKMEKSLTPEKPFFVYFAPGATHTPHQVPEEWSNKYKGKFDSGWDKLREDTYKRQLKMGIIPPNTKLAKKPDFIKDWDKLTTDEKKIAARQMEIFAGFAEQTDYEIGKIIQTLKDIGEYDNTLIFLIAGDNGASAEGQSNGQYNSYSFYNGLNESVDTIVENIDKLGTKESFGHYSAGWAIAGDTPFAWSKTIAGDYGGTRNGLIITWKNGIKDRNKLRTQWSHVIDITPTILEASKIPEPKIVDGIKQVPIQGTSMFYSFNNPKAKDKHTIQYFEVLGNRGIYNDGWFARVIHMAEWDLEGPETTLQNDKWELFNTKEDFSLSTDLANKYPEKLEEMKKLFDQEAIANHVYPLDDRGAERFNAELVGRPDIMMGRKKLTLYEGTRYLTENTFINIKNKSYSITANIEAEDPANTNGVIIAQGSSFAGWTLFVKDGKPSYEYSWLKRESYRITSPELLKKGNNTIKFIFDYDGNGVGKGGTGTLYLNNKKVGTTRFNATISSIFSYDDGVSVGIDDGNAVSTQYEAPFEFNAKVKDVTIDTSDYDSDKTKAENTKMQNKSQGINQ